MEAGKTQETKPAVGLKPKEEVKVPVEFSSINKSISVVKDGDQISIIISPTIAEEIGAYRRCKVMVKFKEGGPLQVIPEV